MMLTNTEGMETAKKRKAKKRRKKADEGETVK